MELQDLQSIFNEKIFRIPDYQRGYSWDEQQLRDLWRDIEILEESKDHYTGMLSVVSKKDTDIIFVVDGQQRITTLIILIHVICNCAQVQQKEWINGKEKKDYIKKYLHRQRGQEGEIIESIFGYEEDNPSHVYFNNKILGLQNMDGSVPNRTLYTQKLTKAQEFFVKKIRNISFEEVAKLLMKVTTQLKFNYYVIDNELNEFVAFETMNNRGKPLSDLELLKNRLIYLSTLLQNNDDEERNYLRKDINSAWKTVYEYLGKNSNPKKALNDDDFLRDHWIINFQYSRDESKVYKDFLLNRHFTAERVASKKITCKDIHAYAKDIQQTVRSYYYMHNPDESEYSEDVKKWLSKLNRLGFGAFKPLITSMLTHHIDDIQSVKILKFAEKFSFVAFNIEFRQSNYRNAIIYRHAHDCHKNPKLFNSITFILPELNNYFSERKFCERVNEDDTSFYGWKGLRYFLYEYELWLQEKRFGEIKVQWENINTETIEHIYPQTPDKGWEHFKDKNLLHDLGNLLLLSRKINSKIQNGPFVEKKKMFQNNSYSANGVSQYENWTPDSILERHKDMIEFLIEKWDLKKEYIATDEGINT